MKIKGISIWIWLFGLVIFSAAGFVIRGKLNTAPALLPLEIVKAEVWELGNGWEVRGEIHNPRKQEVRDLVITYELVGHKMKNKKMIGEVSAEIGYLPAGGTTDFTAIGVHRKDKWDSVRVSEAVITEGAK